MITGLLLSTILPFVVTKFGGMLVSSVLLKLGAGQAAASIGSNLIGSIASKITAGKPLTQDEHAAWRNHINTTYTPTEVGSAPGVPFQRT